MMFAQLLRAEWTKLRSVRRWALALLAMALLTLSFGLLSSTSSVDINQHPDFVVSPQGRPVKDEFQFVHQSLTGDGSITARVVSQANSHEWASAGVIIKDGTRSGSRYAALMLTPGHGVHLGADFTTDIAGSPATSPRWLRLTRTGTTVTGYESADGATWQAVGTVTTDLPSTVEVGLFVNSPPKVAIVRDPGGVSGTETATIGSATFDRVQLESVQPRQSTDWKADGVDRPPTPEELAQPAPPGEKGTPKQGNDTVERDGTFALTGSGLIGPSEPPDDLTQMSLFGVLVGLPAVVAVAVLYITSEYRRGMIRTTFTVTPLRGQVLAAKALVLAAASFVLGLGTSVVSYLLVAPILRRHGFGPPAYPIDPLTDPSLLRAIIGSGAFVALVAVFGLAVGTIMRRSAGAITTVLVLVILPTFVAVVLPTPAAKWLLSLTPAGGFAVQRAKPPTDLLAEPWSMINPWIGIGTVFAYAVVSLAIAMVVVRRRDA